MAFNAPQVLGCPSSGVRASNPPDFVYGTQSIGNMLVSQYATGTAYLNESTGILYKLYENTSTGVPVKSWVIQGYSTGKVTSFLTSDANSATPSSGIITLAGGNGISTSSATNVSTIIMSGSYTGSFTYTGSADTMLTLTSTLSTAGTAGPIINLYRNKATSSNSDVIGEIIFSENNSTPAQKTYAQDFVTITSNTAAAESASWTLQTQVAGTLTTQMVALSTGMQIRGNNTNTASPSGVIGETVKTTVASGSAVALVTATTANLCSLVVPAGNFLLSGSVSVVGGAYTATYMDVGINTVSATFPSSANASKLYFEYAAPSAFDTVDSSILLPTVYVSNASPTTYYVVMLPGFSAGSPTAYGFIQAVRIG